MGKRGRERVGRSGKTQRAGINESVLNPLLIGYKTLFKINRMMCRLLHRQDTVTSRDTIYHVPTGLAAISGTVPCLGVAGENFKQPLKKLLSF